MKKLPDMKKLMARDRAALPQSPAQQEAIWIAMAEASKHVRKH